MEKKDRLEAIHGTIRQNKKDISQFQEIIEKHKKEDPNHKNISLFQRDIWDLNDENSRLLNEYQGRDKDTLAPKGTSGIWLHLTDIMDYLGLLAIDGFEKRRQDIKRIVSLIPMEELNNYPREKKQIEYIKALLRGEGEKEEYNPFDSPKKLPSQKF